MIFVLTSITSCSQDVDKLVSEISDKNIVEYEHVGIGGWTGQNYLKFKELSQKANSNQLIQLLTHENPVVVCYASWALIEQEYEDLPKIFETLIKDGRIVETYSGCLLNKDKLSSEFYHRYWNLVNMKNAKDEVLFELDKIIIASENPNKSLLGRALENRMYDDDLKETIYTLGFKKDYIDAIFYLCNWHRSVYSDELQSFIINELKTTKFKGRNSSTYYKLLDELIKFNNKDLHDFIVDKYRSDLPNINEIENFVNLFERNNIF
ncbi:hypothetical protein H2O64_05950 [Kordia sp. YSTF-M3]|uniref:DUF1638 domain-containing protein n=1 Tax=Kordia aestuariivivens TaxID=2759037 RepID=A0ABR7Q775_9FLAO|nr:hypothetical protein [Kordia aestuariivivens]MBC8754206.1 hypothetical protein [Kordia aestuariivivens]